MMLSFSWLHSIILAACPLLGWDSYIYSQFSFNCGFKGDRYDMHESLKSHVSFPYSWCLVNDGLISNFRCQLFSHKATLGFLPSSPCAPAAVSMTLLNQ